MKHTKYTILISGKPDHFAKASHTAQAFYRFVVPFKELERKIPGLYIEESVSGTVPDLAGKDCVFIHTPTTQNAVQAVANAVEFGVKVWLDFDDLVFDDNIPPANSAWTFFNYKSVREALKMTIPFADVISVSTQTIKDEIVSIFSYPEEKIYVIPNALPDKIWNRRAPFTPRRKGDATVLYRGSVTHEGDITIHRNAWKPIKGVSFAFMGIRPWMLEKQYGIGHLDSKSYGYQPWVKEGMLAYFATLKNIAPDYMVFPLERIKFNRAKSNIAWLEGTLAGAACIVNDDMPEFNPDCCITFNSVKGLARTFEAIGKGNDLRTEKYMKSRAKIESEYLLSITNKTRETIIDSL